MIDLDLSDYDTTLPARPVARSPAPRAPRPRRARRLSDYTGAVARLDPAEGLALDADRHGWQLKSDGAYAVVSTDATGRISRIVSQHGHALPGAADLIGIVAAPPWSVLVGELEVGTDASARAIAARGYACLHLFDAVRVADRYLARAPYLERRAELFAAQSWVHDQGAERVRDWTLDARGNAHSKRGTFTAAKPRDLRRLPILPLHRGTDAARALWSTVESTGAEGLVAVRLDAPIGARRAKVKIKSTDTLDCAVLSADRTASLVVARVASDGAGKSGVRWREVEFTVAGCHAVGSIVEVAHNGWHDSGAPRFARVVRQRHDKAA